jgi:post-segregation antitoxin (ccd killing protein)
VDITVYLPDEVAQRAKAENVNLSRVLRDALTTQFAEEDTVSATLEEARTVTLELKTDEGRAYRGRMEATLIGKDATSGTAVYLRRTGEVITYRPEDRRFRTVDDPASELLAVLPTDDYIAAMDALGIVPEVDLDAGFVVVAPATGAVPPPRQTARRKLRSVPGDLVEPPVSFLKRLAGHGDASTPPAPPAPEAEARSEAPPTPEAPSAPEGIST